jgi:CSLREA domain-containing protein
MRGSVSALKSRRRKRMCLEVLEARQLLSTITVNTTADDTTADSTLSLREAIEVSNGTLAVSSLSTQEQAQVSGTVGSSNTIDFNIPKSDPGYDSATGVWTIKLQLGLPDVSTNAAIIDGYSQPGASKNTLAQGDNAKLAIALSGSSILDGLTIDQKGSQVFGLDFEKFNNGVVITAPGNVQVAGCFLGTDPTGETTGDSSNGVKIENSYNLIGGPNVADRNVISGNLGVTGVWVPDKTTNPLGITPTGNVIENNFIGLDATGTKRLINAQDGVLDNGSGDIYGGTTAGLGNVISGNGEIGIASSGSITIEGNSIGTDATGNVALGNGPNQSGGTGIINNEQLGGTSITTIISNNLVSGNNTGISIYQRVGSSSSYTISNNLIGTNAAGTGALGNLSDGLDLHSVENATVQNNVISANFGGISLTTTTPPSELLHDVFEGNLIGTDKTGTVALGNRNIGFNIDPGSGITIGGTGPGQGNVIANNAFGIQVSIGQQNQFIRNSIHGNTGVPGYPPPGIIVASGANQSVAAPVLTFTPGSTGTLSGALTEVPNTTYVVEVFSNPSAQAVGQAQGETFVQDVTVKTDAAGNGTFSLTEPNGFYTATATDPSGNTSQFSVAVGSLTQPATTTVLTSSLNPSTVGQQVTFTAVVTAPSYQGTPTGTVTFIIDGHDQSPVPLAVVGGHDEAQFTISTLAAGSHSVSASYSGDANVSASTGSLPTQTVNAPGLKATSTTVTSSLDPSTVGQPVTFTAVVSPGAAAGTPTGSVTFTIDGTPQAPVPLHLVKGSDQATLSVASLSKGAHTISASYSGDSGFSASAVSKPLTQTVNAVDPPGVDGPTVVSLKRFGIHMQPTVLVLSFNDGLDPTSAQNLRNYKIIGPGGKPVSIGSAVFNEATNSVTLRPTTRINLHHTYQLMVDGTSPHGVRDSLGLLLDGTNNGKPGSNYKGTLTWKNVVWAPGELDKNGHPKPYKPAGALIHKFLSRPHKGKASS